MSKRKELKQKRAQRQKLTELITTGIVVVVAVAIVVLVIMNQNPPAATREIIIPEPLARPTELVPAGEMAAGDPNAPVTLDVYEDFQCPACKIYTENIEPAIIAQYVTTGQVYYRFVPYSFLDERAVADGWGESKSAAEAAFCAMDQGRFWDYHDILYANQSGENIGDFTNERLLAFAEALGLDMNAFRQCMDADTHRAEVLQIRADGEQAGATHSPYFFINGQAVEIRSTFNELVQAIDAALATP